MAQIGVVGRDFHRGQFRGPGFMVGFPDFAECPLADFFVQKEFANPRAWNDRNGRNFVHAHLAMSLSFSAPAPTPAARAPSHIPSDEYIINRPEYCTRIRCRGF